jgi:branched-chain amino acid transport system substrate-binding protein
MTQKGLNMKRLLAALVLAGTFGIATADSAAGDILVGMSVPLTGPASAIGASVKAGATAYLDRLNADGGIDGRKVRLVVEDDGYDPDRAAANTEKFLGSDVFALLGYVGTPTSIASYPLAMRAQVPFLAPLTGAETLRTPAVANVFHLRASYFEEIDRLVDRITKKGLKQISVFAQDDSFGDAGRIGVLRAVHARGLSLAGEARYSRNGTSVEVAYTTLRNQHPDAVIMIATPGAAAELVRLSKNNGFKPVFLGVSFVAAEQFIAAAGLNAEGTYLTQVVPAPGDTGIGAVARYNVDMHNAGASPDYLSLESYMAAWLFAEAVKRSDGTRAGVLRTMQSMKTSLDGFPLQFSRLNHQGSHNTYFTVVKGGKVLPAESIE